MLSQDELKRQVAQEALNYIRKHLISEAIIGVGTGSTADYFIDALASCKDDFKGAVASSERSAARLKRHGIPVFDLNSVISMPVYVDGADEINPKLQMIKGGGGALTREKIVASAAREFVCIVDESKWVMKLGKFPLPIEVLPLSQALVTRRLLGLGAEKVRVRENFITDNGNPILDAYGLDIQDAAQLEAQINHIPGVVTCGLFAMTPASVVLMGTQKGVELIAHTNNPRL